MMNDWHPTPPISFLDLKDCPLSSGGGRGGRVNAILIAHCYALYQKVLSLRIDRDLNDGWQGKATLTSGCVIERRRRRRQGVFHSKTKTLHCTSRAPQIHPGVRGVLRRVEREDSRPNDSWPLPCFCILKGLESREITKVHDTQERRTQKRLYRTCQMSRHLRSVTTRHVLIDCVDACGNT